MKKKVIDIIVDILLIAAVFAITDTIVLKVFRSESIWVDLGVYLVIYAIIFGIKSGTAALWKRQISDKKNGGKENEKNQ